MKKVQLLTKGSNPGNAGPAGWGLLLRWSPAGRSPIGKTLSGATEEGCANRMELIAAIRGTLFTERILQADGGSVRRGII